MKFCGKSVDDTFKAAMGAWASHGLNIKTSGSLTRSVSFLSGDVVARFEEQRPTLLAHPAEIRWPTWHTFIQINLGTPAGQEPRS
jgi:hypothetical protein